MLVKCPTPDCNNEVEVYIGKKVPYAYCKSCGTRMYFKKGINLEEVKGDTTGTKGRERLYRIIHRARTGAD